MSGPFKMKGTPMQRNFGIGGPLPLRTEPTTTKTTETTETPEVDPMFGSLNEDGTKIVNEQGNWVSLTKGTEGSLTRKRATKAGAISGGPDVQ